MICFRDRTYCPYWTICKNGQSCNRALTDNVKAAAERWWGKPGAPICVYSEAPECFVPFFIQGGKGD